MIMSMMNRQNYGSGEEKSDHKRLHTTKNNRFNITDIFVHSDEMRFAPSTSPPPPPSLRHQRLSVIRWLERIQCKCFSTIRPLFERGIFVRESGFLFRDKLHKMKMFVRKLI